MTTLLSCVMLARRHKFIKRIVISAAALAGLYLCLLLILLPLLERALGLGVYQKSTGVYRNR